MPIRCSGTHLRLAGLFVAAAVLIGVSGIPRFNHGSRLYLTIGDIGWFGGVFLLVCFLVSTAVTVLRARRRRPEQTRLLSVTATRK